MAWGVNDGTVYEGDVKETMLQMINNEIKGKRSYGRTRKRNSIAGTKDDGVAHKARTNVTEEVPRNTQEESAKENEFEKPDGLPHETDKSCLPKVKIRKKSTSYCFQCDVCQKTFRSVRGMKEHKLAEHSLVLPFSCELCGANFKYQNSLRVHKISKHCAVRPHLCSVCKKTFLTSSHLNTHYNAVHLQLKKFTCRHCGKGFGYKNSCDHHERGHRGEKRYECTKCERRFITSSALSSHQSSHNTMKTSQCTYCGKFYKNALLLRMHMRRHTNEGIICDVCGQTFLHESSLRMHADTHGSARQFSCKTCGKSFKTNATLYSHQIVHAVSSPFSCGVCDKTFKTKPRLHAHEIRHGETKTYGCHHCSKKFAAKGDLSKHVKTLHSKKQSFICSVCGKESTRADNLRVHMMRVHGYDPKELTYEKIIEMSEKLRSKPTIDRISVKTTTNTSCMRTALIPTAQTTAQTPDSFITGPSDNEHQHEQKHLFSSLSQSPSSCITTQSRSDMTKMTCLSDKLESLSRVSPTPIHTADSPAINQKNTLLHSLEHWSCNKLDLAGGKVDMTNINHNLATTSHMTIEQVNSLFSHPATNDNITWNLTNFNSTTMSNNPMIGVESNQPESIPFNTIPQDLANQPGIMPAGTQDITRPLSPINLPLASIMMAEPFHFPNIDVGQVMEMNRLYPFIYSAKPPN